MKRNYSISETCLLDWARAVKGKQKGKWFLLSAACSSDWLTKINSGIIWLWTFKKKPKFLLFLLPNLGAFFVRNIANQTIKIFKKGIRLEETHFLNLKRKRRVFNLWVWGHFMRWKAGPQWSQLKINLYIFSYLWYLGMFLHFFWCFD